MKCGYRDKPTRDLMRKSVLDYIGDKEIFVFDPYSEDYLVSNTGKVFNTRTKKFLKLTKNDTNYFYVTLYVDKKRQTFGIHRVVARAFLNDINYEVNHIDGNKANNNLTNLELVTRSENLQHAKDNKLYRSLPGDLNPSCRFKTDIVRDMVELKKLGFPLKEIAESYGSSISYVCTLIKKGEKLCQQV